MEVIHNNLKWGWHTWSAKICRCDCANSSSLWACCLARSCNLDKDKDYHKSTCWHLYNLLSSSQNQKQAFRTASLHSCIEQYPNFIKKQLIAYRTKWALNHSKCTKLGWIRILFGYQYVICYKTSLAMFTSIFTSIPVSLLTIKWHGWQPLSAYQTVYLHINSYAD